MCVSWKEREEKRREKERVRVYVWEGKREGVFVCASRKEREIKRDKKRMKERVKLVEPHCGAGGGQE